MSNFKYPIDPEKVYTLSYSDEYGELEKEVTGEEILAAFRRDAFLTKLLSEIDDDALHEITEL